MSEGSPIKIMRLARLTWHCYRVGYWYVVPYAEDPFQSSLDAKISLSVRRLSEKLLVGVKHEERKRRAWELFDFIGLAVADYGS